MFTRSGTTAALTSEHHAEARTFAELAFDALKSIRYENLVIELNGAIDGEMVTEVRFNGVPAQLYGLAGADTLVGDCGLDTIAGGDGDDVIDLGHDFTALDRIDGGDGQDTVKIDGN